MKYHSSKVVVQQVVEALNVLGVSQIVISPGSRNAPFMLELNNDNRFKCFSIIDERAAAFFALGLTQQAKNPVAIICTSGTALLNYAPAVAEAYYQRKNLIVISADRPAFWINKGEGQSILQTNVFKPFTEASYQLAEDEDENALSHNYNLLCELIFQINEMPGPVHLNVPFNEPLYLIERRNKEIEYSISQPIEKHDSLSWIEDLRGKKIMILLGQHQESEDFLTELEVLARSENVAVFAELHSNALNQNFISSFDTLIMALGENATEIIQPDILITLGTNIISRKIKAILRKCKPIHYHIGLNEKPMDTYNCLNAFYQVSPKRVFHELQKTCTSEMNYGSRLRTAYLSALELGMQYINSAPFSDLKAMQTIANQIPEFCSIQLGNSSIIRYYHLVHTKKINRFESNRGVAGIDGCTSTAVGFAYNSNEEVYFISGDLAFMYDSNAFWNNYVSKNLKIIVINNRGGGIFRIIDGAKEATEIAYLQETPHHSSVRGLVERFNLNYLSASTEDELFNALDVLRKAGECTVLEVCTPQAENAKILDSFFKAIHLNHE